jgi:putative Mn2+ efflux pump MntP
MTIYELMLLALGLSMDAFAVSICKGLAMDRITLRKAMIVGIWFGGFQALMPLLGYFLGTQFTGYITALTHWIAFILLTAIGANMLREALSKKEDRSDTNCSLGFKVMFVMAVATSIDALAVGVTFAFLEVNILTAVLLIGVLTFFVSMAGVKIGNVFGTRYQKTAEMAGGIILILLGIKVLLEQFGIFI